MARAPNRDVVLRRLYYNKDSTVFYGSVKTLTAAARTHGISAVDVRKWLRSQPAHALHQPPRKVPKRDKIRSAGPFTHCHADLIDFRNIGKENANRKYVLVLVDAFTTLIFARSQYSKRPAETTKSLLSILKAMEPYRMHNLTTDRGKEFSGPFQKALHSRMIGHYYASDPTVKASLAERCVYQECTMCAGPCVPSKRAWAKRGLGRATSIG